MYKIRIVEPFPCSVQETYEATSRDFDPLAKYIPNVTLIKTLVHETLDDGRERWALKFHGDGAIPLIARPVINPSMLRWKEELVCNPKDMTIEWSIVTDHFTDHFKCVGITYNREKPGGGSEVEVKGVMELTLRHIPGFPDSLVQKAAALFEPFVGKLIEPNLRKFYQAVKKRMANESKIK